jgi:hypothetical protein
MGFNFGNAINSASIEHHTRECLKKLGAAMGSVQGTTSTIIRENESIFDSLVLSDELPNNVGSTASAGTQTRASRWDHIHKIDTTSLGIVTGAGTIYRIPKWTSASAVGDSKFAVTNPEGSHVLTFDTTVMTAAGTYKFADPDSTYPFVISGAGAEFGIARFTATTSGTGIYSDGALSYNVNAGSPIFHALANTVRFQSTSGVDLQMGDVSGANYVHIQASGNDVTFFGAGVGPSWSFNDPVDLTDNTGYSYALSLGENGQMTSHVTDASGAKVFRFKTAFALSLLTDRYYYSLEDNNNNRLMDMRGDGSWELGGGSGSGTVGGFLNIAGTRQEAVGFYFITTQSGAGSAAPGTAWTSNIGGVISPKDHASGANTLIGATIAPQLVNGRAHDRVVGILVPFPVPGNATANYGDYWGTYYQATATHGGATVRTINNIAANYVTLLQASTLNKPLIINNYGLAYVEEQKNATTINNGAFFANATRGYKAAVFGNQNAYIGGTGGELELGGTTFNVVFYDNDIVSYDDDMVTY